MRISQCDIPGLRLITPSRWEDERGFFSETFKQDVFDEMIGPTTFVQDNHSRSRQRGTVRGFHFQSPPFAQGKLVRVTRGAVYDVAVDIRHSSPTYARYFGIELSAENWRQLWVPPGFLHGFCTLTDDVELLYKVTARYSPAHDFAVAFDDPDIGVDWPVNREKSVMSDKDKVAPHLKELPAMFHFAN